MEITTYSDYLPETYAPVTQERFSPLLLKQEGGWGQRVELDEAVVHLYQEEGVGEDAPYGFACVRSGNDAFFCRRPKFVRELARPFLDYPGGGVRHGGPRMLSGQVRTLLVLDATFELMPRYLVQVKAGEALMVFGGDGIELGLGGALDFEEDELWVVGSDRVLRIAPRPEDLIAERDDLDLTGPVQDLIDEHDPDHLLLSR